MITWLAFDYTRQLLYQGVVATGEWLNTHQEAILFAAFAVIIAAAVWLVSGMWHTHYAGKREMAKKNKEDRKALCNMLYEKWLDLTLDLYSHGKITDKQQAFADYVVARAFGTTDMMPKQSQDYIQRRIKSYLKWKRTSTDIEAVKLREKHAAPVNIPGPKPGEDIQFTTIAKATVRDKLAKAFSRKKAA